MSQHEERPPSQDETPAWVVEGNRVELGDLTSMALGDFQVERLLGRGGMGEVYLARQLSLDRPVALKVLRPDFVSKGVYLNRFKAEATAIARLNHPNIVHVYAIGEVGQVHYIAMEYVEGTNLREHVRKRGPLDLAQALSIMKQAAQAIGAAGEEGVIHRDVKPENLLLTKRGRVKVADFGLCLFEGEEALHLTQAGVTMGTPHYMSPEQAQGHPLDHRSDLYSLGVTYYYMLAGSPPFRAETAVALALKHVRELPPSLMMSRPDLPLEVDRLVMKLMAKDPGDRYQSAAMMLADFARIRDLVQAQTGTMVPEHLERTEELTTSAARRKVAASAPADAAAPAVPAKPPTRSLALAEPATASPAQGTRARPAPAAHRPSASAAHAGAAAGAGAVSGPIVGADASRRGQAGPGPAPAVAPAPARFQAGVAALGAAIGLAIGALLGWAERAPDVLTAGVAPGPPALWLVPSWSDVPKQAGPEEQARYALLQAPPERWAAAWLAVPGHFPHSHGPITTAYAQLARLWYRQNHLDALEALRAELTNWPEAQARDKDLINVVRLALQLKKGDMKEVETGLKGLAQSDLNELHDSIIVALGLEVCADALASAERSGSQTMAEPLRQAARALARRICRLEVVGPPPAGEAPSRRKARPRSAG